MNIVKFQKLVIKNKDIEVAIKYNNLLERISNKNNDFKKLKIGGGSLFKKEFQDYKNKLKNLENKSIMQKAKIKDLIQKDKLIQISKTKKNIKTNKDRLGIEHIKGNCPEEIYDKLISLKNKILNLYNKFEIEWFQDNKYIIFILVFYLMYNKKSNIILNSNDKNMFFKVIKFNNDLRKIIFENIDELKSSIPLLSGLQNSSRLNNKAIGSEYLFYFLEGSIFYIIFNIMEIQAINIQMYTYIKKIDEINDLMKESKKKELNIKVLEFINYYLNNAFNLLITNNENNNQYLNENENIIHEILNKYIWFKEEVNKLITKNLQCLCKKNN